MKLCLFVLSVLGLLGTTAVAQDTFSLRILHANDHHSHLAAETFTLDTTDLNIAPQEDNEVDVTYGGFPSLVSLAQSLKQDGEDNGMSVLKLHAGDAVTGTTFYTLFRGEADAALMQQVCFDAFALGNHEFDDGDAGLAEFITDLQDSATCPDTSVVAANVVPGEQSPLKALQDSGKLQASTVKTFGNETVGIIGIDIRNSTLFSSSPDAGTDVLDEIQTTTAQAAALTDQGVNKIIVLAHVTFDNGIDWLAEIPGVDIVVTGHSHTLLGDDAELGEIFNPVDTYPAEITASDGRKVCIVQAWEYGHGLGKLDIVFDESGSVVSCVGQTVFPIDSTVSDLSEDDSSTVTTFLEGLGESFVVTAPDTDVEQLLGTFSEQLAVLIETTIADVPEDICFERIPGQGRSNICPVEATTQQGGGVCNLVAQAFLDQSFTADVAIQNAGGCRTDIAMGNFTYDDAYTLLPFSNTLVTLEMTGEEIALVLEQGVDFALDEGGSTGAYPYAAGLRYDINANGDSMAMAGSLVGTRVTNIEVNSRLVGEWVPLDNEAVYTVVTNSFVSAGRDGYLQFGEIEDSLKVDLLIEYATAFIDFAEQEGTLLDPPLDTYSTKSFVPKTVEPSPTSAPVAAPTNAPVAPPPPTDSESCSGQTDALVQTTEYQEAMALVDAELTRIQNTCEKKDDVLQCVGAIDSMVVQGFESTCASLGGQYYEIEEVKTSCGGGSRTFVEIAVLPQCIGSVCDGDEMEKQEEKVLQSLQDDAEAVAGEGSCLTTTSSAKYPFATVGMLVASAFFFLGMW